MPNSSSIDRVTLLVFDSYWFVAVMRARRE
jgi:hypothetical protein